MSIVQRIRTGMNLIISDACFSADVDFPFSAELLSIFTEYAQANNSLVRVYATRKGLRVSNLTLDSRQIPLTKVVSDLQFLKSDQGYIKGCINNASSKKLMSWPYYSGPVDHSFISTRVTPKFVKLPSEFWIDNQLEPYYNGQFFWPDLIIPELFLRKGTPLSEMKFHWEECAGADCKLVFKENLDPRATHIKAIYESYLELIKFYENTTKYGVFDFLLDLEYGPANPDLVPDISLTERKTKARLLNKILI